jgi:hypothetical protein
MGGGGGGGMRYAVCGMRVGHFFLFILTVQKYCKNNIKKQIENNLHNECGFVRDSSLRSE